MLKRSKKLHVRSFFTAVVLIIIAISLTLFELYQLSSSAMSQSQGLYWISGLLVLLLIFLGGYHFVIISEFSRCDEAVLENKRNNATLALQNKLFRHVEEVSCIGYFTYEFESGLETFSDNLFRILGYEPLEMTASKGLLVSHIEGEDKETVMDWLDHNTSETFAEEVKVELRSNSTKHKTISMSRKVFVEDDKKVLLVTLKDITKEAIVNKDLEIKNRELFDKNEELDSFNYMAGHDLREPIRKIQTLLSMVLRFPGLDLPEEVMGYFSRINRSAERMKNLISDLLEFSRISEEPNVFEDYSIQQVIENMLEELEFKINAANATIQVDDLPDAKIIPTQMTQLFTNLLENALKFKSLERDPIIKINREEINERDFSFFPHTDRNSLLKITVSDNGVGFESELSDTIFLIFNRLHDKQRYPGSGIGLAICKKIVEHHGGIIYAEGKLDKGAKITVIIPILEPVANS